MIKRNVFQFMGNFDVRLGEILDHLGSKVYLLEKGLSDQ